MSTYLLTTAADADIEEIWQYLARQSGPGAADRLQDQLHAAMKRLAQSPGMGHFRADLADEPLRFWAVHSILIVYRPETKPLQIIRVLHGARDIAFLLSG